MVIDHAQVSSAFAMARYVGIKGEPTTEITAAFTS
jgi:hypothetical protein